MLANKTHWDQIQDLIRQNHLDAILLTSQQNRYWMTGFSNSSGYYFADKEHSILFVDGRYQTAIKGQTHDCEVQIVKDAFKDINKAIKDFHITKLGVEAEYCTYNFIHLIEKEIQGVIIVPISVRSLRMIKTPQEIEILQTAATITDETLAEVLNNFKVGKTEFDLQKEILQSFIDQGIDTSFKVVLNSGAKGALPHGKASERIINKGELVTIDFGCIYQEYHTDMTRTVAIGEVSDELKKIYFIVKEAQQAGIDAVKIGIQCSAVHQIVYDIIAKYGYAEYFLHQTGHGVGIETHEAPRVASYDNTILQEGMIVTIEPGIYVEKLGGVRIEDMVLVTKNGGKPLTKLDKNLINILEKPLKIIN